MQLEFQPKTRITNMIVVIADDFTGAAEIGGMGLRFGLSVEIVTQWPFNSDSDLVVIATNTRSKSVKEAVDETGELAAYLDQIKPDWIFKKIDSALRGHVLEETMKLMEQLNHKSALLVPANPRLKRFIRDGIYYIDGIPLGETSFANDPEYSIESSSVLDLLGNRSDNIQLNYIQPAQKKLNNGINIAEVKSKSDMDIWACSDFSDTLLVGAAGFFESILICRNYNKVTEITSPKIFENHKRLIICGSAYSNSRKFVRSAEEKGLPVSYMCDKLFEDQSLDAGEIGKWKNEVIALLEKNDEAIIAIKHDVVRNIEKAFNLKKKMSSLVKLIHAEYNITEFFIEGGATAYEILDILNFKTLIPVFQYNQGVIRLKVKDQKNIVIVLKPGSYVWPENVLTINQIS